MKFGILVKGKEAPDKAGGGLARGRMFAMDAKEPSLTVVYLTAWGLSIGKNLIYEGGNPDFFIRDRMGKIESRALDEPCFS